MVAKVAAAVLALASAYALAWGVVNLVADRSTWSIVLSSDGSRPFEFFPDPGGDQQRLMALAVVVGITGLVLALALAARSHRRPS